ncbi:MAG: methyltransferase domain-containing protein [Elusimicrobiota bacterium]
MSDFDPETYTAEQRAAWNEAAPRYEALSSSLFEPVTEEFMDFAGVRKGWHVLDVACGPGIASRAAARRAAQTGSVLAVDLAPGMVKLASSRPAGKRSAPIEFRVMDAQKLELPDASCDAAICQLGLMLFARPDAALAEMRRVVVPGGPVACLVQGRRSAMLFTALVMDAIIARAPQLRAPKGSPTLYAFGPDDILEEHFSRAGLTEMATRRLSGVFRFPTPEDYWTRMTEGAGRTGAMLRSLASEVQLKVKADVLRRAAKRKVGRAVEIPYEFVVARGLTPMIR